MSRTFVRYTSALAVVAITLAWSQARAEDDPKNLYDVSFHASPKVKKGASGRLAVKILAKNGGELHEETPLSLSVQGPDAIAFSKAKYGRGDSKSTSSETSIDAPFTGKESGSGNIDATLTFVVCNATNCFRQTVKGTAPVAVE